MVGLVAIRDAKVTDLIWTIDTWYESGGSEPIPIPFEPNGANLSFMRFFHPGKSSAFDMLKQLDMLDIENDDAESSVALPESGPVRRIATQNDAGALCKILNCYEYAGLLYLQLFSHERLGCQDKTVKHNEGHISHFYFLMKPWRANSNHRAPK